MIREACCAACSERFNPADDDDLIHLEREDGTACGGQGQMTGYYAQNAREAEQLSNRASRRPSGGHR
jgi:hypothetical protein